MATLRAPPYNLVLGDPIQGIVRAKNIVGWSTSFSQENS